MALRRRMNRAVQRDGRLIAKKTAVAIGFRTRRAPAATALYRRCPARRRARERHQMRRFRRNRNVTVHGGPVFLGLSRLVVRCLSCRVCHVLRATSHSDPRRKQAGCNTKAQTKAPLTCRPADHAPARGHNQLAADLHKTTISGQIEALEGLNAGFWSWLNDAAGTKMHIRQKRSKMGVDTSTHPRLYPLHTDGNATRRRRDRASLEKRLPQPESLRATAKVVPEAPLFDKCRQKEKRGRRCSCGLAFGSVIDETLAVLRFSSSLFDCESNQV